MHLFRLYLSPIDEIRFKVIVTDSPAGEKEVDSKLPFFDDHFDRRITVLKALEAVNFRQQDFPDEGEQAWMVRMGLLTEDRHMFNLDIREHIGKELYKALFPEGSEVKELLQKSIALAHAEGELPLLHVQFKIEADVARQGRARLADYPWELICDDRGFLARRQVVFSRYLAFNDVPPNLSSVKQMNVLLLSSVAFDPAYNLPQFSSRDQQAIREGLENAGPEHINVHELKPATFNRLRAYLTEQRDEAAPHVLHFDGHGYFGKRCEKCRMNYSNITAIHCGKCGEPLPLVPQGFLLFEDEAGQPDYVSAQKLGHLLQNANVTLVVLSACRSGFSQGSEAVFNGVAQSLVSHRVPAVVAMQYKVSVSAAAAFAEQFYRSLGQRFPLVHAVSWGREAVGLEGNQWYRPVLYLRWQDNEGGQLSTIPHGERVSTWVRSWSQHIQQTFVDHMSAEEGLLPEQATERYVELLVKERGESQLPSQSFPLSQIIEQSPSRVLLLSEGGGGKTTGLLKLAFDAAKRTAVDPNAAVPLYIKLNFFDAKERSLDRLLQMASDAVGLNIEEMRTLWRKSPRPLLFLLDGFNEIGQDFQAAGALALQELLQGKQHQYVISSRPGSQVEQLAVPGIQILDLVQLNEDQIEEFLAHQGLSKLYEHMGEQLRGLVGNPFMLRALVQSCKTLPEHKLPTNRGQLYQTFIDDYIFKKREPYKHPPQTRYNYEQVKRPLLALLACEMTQKGITRIRLDEPLQNDLIARLEGIEIASKRRKRIMPENWTLSDFLNEVVYNGVLRQVGTTLEFMHQSVQDYFTALAMASWTIEQIIEVIPPFVWRHINFGETQYKGQGERSRGSSELPEQVNSPFATATIMLSGLLLDSSDLLKTLEPRHPLLAAYSLAGAATVQPNIRDELRTTWLTLLGRRHKRYRLAACRCLTIAQFRDTEVAHRMVDTIFREDDFSIQREAAHALQASGPDIVIPLLVEISFQELNDTTYYYYTSDKQWRRAAWTLFAIRSRLAVKLLLDTWRSSENNMPYRNRAKLLLAILERDLVAQQLERISQEAFQEGNTSIKEAAEEALRSLDSWRKQMGTVHPISPQEVKVIWKERRLRIEAMPLQSFSTLTMFLRDDSPQLREAAVRELGERRDRQSSTLLIEALWQETDPFCIRAILISLRKSGIDAETLRLLRADLENTDSNKQKRAALVLGILEVKDTIPLLKLFLRVDDTDLRLKSLIVLGEIKDINFTDDLIEMFWQEDGEHKEVLSEIITALGRMKTERVFASLVEFLLRKKIHRHLRFRKGEDNFSGEYYWAEAIHEILEQSGAYSQTMVLLSEALQSQDASVRFAAVVELGRWRSAEPQTTALLQQALHDQDTHVRTAAVWSISNQKERGSQVIELLCEALRDPSGKVREEAVVELGLHQRQQTEEVLIEVALSDVDETVRERAAYMLRWFDSETISTQLIHELQKTDTARKITAIEALGVIEDEAAVSMLTLMLGDKQSIIRIASAISLLKMKNDTAFDEATKTLVTALTGNRSEIRGDMQIAAAILLMETENKTIFDVLAQTLVEVLQNINTPIQQIVARTLMTSPDAAANRFTTILYPLLEDAFIKRNYREVVQLTQELLSFFPKEIILYLWSSEANLELGQFEMALADVNQLIIANPRAASLQVTHSLRANILSQLGRNDNALAAAQQAAEIDAAKADI